MNASLKALIVWLMLLAVPLQGFAAATQLLCAPPPAVAHLDGGTAMAGTVAAGMAEVHGDQTHAAAPGTRLHVEKPAQSHFHHHADSKCNACATCCCGAAMAPSFAVSLPVQPPQFESIPFIPRHTASADLALPERPPRA